MFTITPIGSCRIAGPLRIGQDRYGIGLNQSRVYGYCHSPAEAVQMARFLKGEIEIPSDIWPLVSRKFTQASLRAQAHAASDLYIVELASAKELTIDGVSIQLNYLNATYQAFFADPMRAGGFWDLAQDNNPQALAAYLEQHWSDTDAQRADSAMLARIALRFVTEDSLIRDINTLRAMLGNVMFVSHVNAKRPCGNAISSRAGFIDMVERTVTTAGLPFTNPTALMEEFGQQNAIEDHSTSLAHYTPPFSAALIAKWLDKDADLATDRLDPAHLICDAARKGQFEAALDFAVNAPSGFAVCSPYQLIEIALKAEAAGQADTAFEFALAALRQNSNLARAAKLAARLAMAQEFDLLGELTRPQITKLFGHLDMAQKLDLAQHWTMPAAAFVTHLASEAELIEAVFALSDRDAFPEAADMIGAWRDFKGQARIANPELVAVMDSWAGVAAQTANIDDRIATLALIHKADPRHAGLRKEMKAARLDLAKTIRNAAQDGALDALDSLEATVGMLPQPLGDYDLWRARLSYAQGDYERALTHGLAASEHMPKKINLWVLLMRVAKDANKITLAQDFAGHVSALASDKTHKLKLEADALLQTQAEAV